MYKKKMENQHTWPLVYKKKELHVYANKVCMFPQTNYAFGLNIDIAGYTQK
jgi:hypothetical protein